MRINITTKDDFKRYTNVKGILFGFGPVIRYGLYGDKGVNRYIEESNIETIAVTPEEFDEKGRVTINGHHYMDQLVELADIYTNSIDKESKGEKKKEINKKYFDEILSVISAYRQKQAEANVCTWKDWFHPAEFKNIKLSKSLGFGVEEELDYLIYENSAYGIFAYGEDREDVRSMLEVKLNALQEDLKDETINKQNTSKYKLQLYNELFEDH